MAYGALLPLIELLDIQNAINRLKMQILNWIFLCGQHISNTFTFMHKKYQANPWRIDWDIPILLLASNWVVFACLAKSCEKDSNLLYYFPKRKPVKPIWNDSGIRTTFWSFSSYYSSTCNYTACFGRSNVIIPFLLTQHGVFWVNFFHFCLLFFLFIPSKTARLRSYLDRWMYSARISVSFHHLHLLSDPASSLERHETTDQERKDHHQSRSIYLPFLSKSLLFPNASLHVDRVTLAILSWYSQYTLLMFICLVLQKKIVSRFTSVLLAISQQS